jgi:hypothetical protein
MGVAQGYGKIVTSGLVFAYDAGDYRNSYLGAPGQNYAGGPYKNYSGLNITNFENGKVLRANGYSEQVFIPTLGIRIVESIEFYNEYDGYGTNGNYNCCPNIYSYTTGGWGAFPWLPATTYTYKIIYKSETGYTHPNYMYHYQYRANGSYITEYGLHTEGQRTHLGDGWYHAWNTFTTSAEASYGFCGMWHYEYYGKNKVSVAAVSIVPGTIIRPPLQFIDEGTTRATSQSLLDLTGGSTLTAACSYKSNGEMTFDGTDDKIDINRSDIVSGTGPFTVEAVINNVSGYGVIIGNYGPGYTSNSIWVFAGGMYLNGGYGYMDNYGSIMNGLHHLVCIREADGTFKTYQDGVLRRNTNPGSPASVRSDINWRIGVDVNSTNAEPFNGDIHLVKVYNKALTEAEVLQNYRHYKTRFNI